MASLHERVATVLDRSGALATALRLRRLVPMLGVVTFHRIAEPTPDDPFDPDVVDATPEQFRRRVELLARFGTPVGIDEVIAAVGGARLPPNAFLITFDDGYRSCRDVVLPILRELGVPATFFIATGFANGDRLYWWEQISAYLARTERAEADLAYPTRQHLELADPRLRWRLDQIVKNTQGLDLERFLAELRTALGVEWSAELEAALARPLIMSWEHVAELAAAGMGVESHTHHHRVLETLDSAALHDELVRSRRDLELRLSRRVRAIAYPVGRTPSERVRNATRDAGYEVAFSNFGGTNVLLPWWARSCDPFALRRVAAERSQSEALFLAQAAIPWLSYG